MPISLRTMREDDISSAMELSSVANWNQTGEDWRRILHLSPEDCRCIEDGGKVAATATLLPYGTRLAWIGMVLTRPEYRRQGLARQMMEDAISRAEQRGIRTLKLDATEEGRPLYESLGFAVENKVERWGWDSGTLEFSAGKTPADEGPSEGPIDGTGISDDLRSMDAEAFGTGRMELLRMLSRSGGYSATANGYVFSRPGRLARYLGPCVASSVAAARNMIARRLGVPMYLPGEHPGSSPWYWDLLPANAAAVGCAQMFGFTRRRELWRMRRGQEIESNNAMIYAIAGFELG